MLIFFIFSFIDMGTRSLTFVYDEQGQIILVIYRQFDGSPGSHGFEIATFLVDGVVVNGISMSPDRPKKLWNGMGCLAASLVAKLKTEIGNIYIHAPEAVDCGQDYEYHIYSNKVVVKNPRNEIFSGTWTDYHTFCSA